MNWYLLLPIIPVAIVIYLIWDHRRKAVQRAAASAERLNAILGATTHVPPPLDAPDTPSTRDANKIEPIAATLPTTAPTSYVLRERMLPPPDTLLFYLLKTSLPEYHVFARVSLPGFLQAAPSLGAYARNEQMRRLASQSVDFLVCDRGLRPLVVVELVRPEEPAPTLAARKSWIASAGLRYVSFEPGGLPRREALRGLVLGGVTAGERQPVPATGQ